ncbi:MAG: hypothetical protein M3513_01885 [Actinomycetota bacterium]|nr:hypothetical protein [Actinomycetota bacterium]
MDRPTNLRLDDQLCFALYAATNAVVRAYRPLLDRIGLTLSSGRTASTPYTRSRPGWPFRRTP